MEILRKKQGGNTEDDLSHMKKVVGYIRRHSVRQRASSASAATPVGRTPSKSSGRPFARAELMTSVPPSRT